MASVTVQLPELPGNHHKEELYNELVVVYNAIRKLESAVNYDLGLTGETADALVDLSPADGVSTRKDRVYCAATETVSYGQMVAFYTVSGAIKARLAKSSGTEHRCWAVCNSVGTHTAGTILEFALGNCKINSVGGLSPGTEYFLSSTPGAVTNVPDPLTDSNIQQSIGVALGGTDFWFAPSTASKVVSIIIGP